LCVIPFFYPCSQNIISEQRRSLSLGGRRDLELGVFYSPPTSVRLFTLDIIPIDRFHLEVRRRRAAILRVRVRVQGIRIVAVGALLGLTIGIEPGVVPVAQEDLDFGAEAKVLDVACDAFPLDGALVETFLDVSEVSEIHPVDEEVERRGIGDGKEKDGMIGRARH
jgi:hypothetical protein